MLKLNTLVQELIKDYDEKHLLSVLQGCSTDISHNILSYMTNNAEWLNSKTLSLSHRLTVWQILINELKDKALPLPQDAKIDVSINNSNTLELGYINLKSFETILSNVDKYFFVWYDFLRSTLIEWRQYMKDNPRTIDIRILMAFVGKKFRFPFS